MMNAFDQIVSSGGQKRTWQPNSSPSSACANHSSSTSAIDPPGGDLGSGRGEHGFQILEVTAEGRGAKGLEVGHELVAGAHAAPEEVEPDDGEAALGEQLGQSGEKSPVHEPFEAVADDDRRPGAGLYREIHSAVECAPARRVENERVLFTHAAILATG